MARGTGAVIRCVEHGLALSSSTVPRGKGSRAVGARVAGQGDGMIGQTLLPVSLGTVRGSRPGRTSLFPDCPKSGRTRAANPNFGL